MPALRGAIAAFPRFPKRASKRELLPVAYYYMFLSRVMEETLVDLFRKGSVKGTVIISIGNEATSIGMALPLRYGVDVVSFLQRDFGSHLVAGSSPLTLLCQYLANADSPTHGREGNVHHGDALQRRFPMISHLGNMLAPVVGGVWAARQRGEDALGLAVIGDGGSSTGDFHEAINFASVRAAPVLFIIENNHYAFSTPTRFQYRCEKLSDRARGYGIEGRTIDGADVWETYTAVCDALDSMHKTSLPAIVECMTLRLMGHAAYDNAEYVTAQERAGWMLREPLMRARRMLLEECAWDEADAAAMESAVRAEVDEALRAALSRPRPAPDLSSISVFAPSSTQRVAPLKAAGVKLLTAVNLALDHLLERNPEAVLLGQDIGPYGSAFKSCKGLHAKYGASRVIDTPICESATVGFALGASQTGARPIVEFQFADFSTEAATQLGLNCASWFFRSGHPAPILFRMPCGGGITLGAFHSAEFEGLWSRFPGLKLLYPFTPQEAYEAITAGFHDPNPCVVFEHKLLYWSQSGDIDFDGDLGAIWRPRCYAQGAELTLIAWGAALRSALAYATASPYSVEVWNPFILCPVDWEPLAKSVEKTGRLVVAQESGEIAGLGERYISQLTQRCFARLKAAPALVAAPNMPVPFAPELEKAYLPASQQIAAAVEKVMLS